MAVLTISLLLSVVEQFLQNFCSAPLKKIELHLVNIWKYFRRQKLNKCIMQCSLRLVTRTTRSSVNIGQWNSQP